MTYLDYLDIAICVLLYIPLGIQILQGTVKQNFATWILWALLDAIATASIIYQHGNFTVVAIYVCGGTGISLCILKSKNFSWGKFETFTACMAATCMIIWAISGPRNATIASTIAVLIAAGPLIKEAHQTPWHHSLITWLGFLLVNIIGTIQGKAWSVQERFYPASCTVLCFVLVVLTAQKLWVSQPPATEIT